MLNLLGIKEEACLNAKHFIKHYAKILIVHKNQIILKTFAG